MSVDWSRDYDADVQAYKDHPENYAIDLLARRVAERLPTESLEALDVAALRQYELHETKPTIKAALSDLRAAILALAAAYRDEDLAGPGGAVG